MCAVPELSLQQPSTMAGCYGSNKLAVCVDKGHQLTGPYCLLASS